MKYKGTLLAVRDMRKSLDFYRTVFGLEIVNDFGANKELTGEIMTPSCILRKMIWTLF